MLSALRSRRLVAALHPPCQRVLLRCSARRCSSGVAADLFAALHVERRFDLEESSLHRAYKDIMVVNHPDRFAGQDEGAQQAAADVSSSATHAFTVLKHPHRRAMHLLELLGQPLDEDSGGLLDGAFLMEVMEAREALEDGPGLPRLRDLRAHNDAQVGGVSDALAAAFHERRLEDARVLTAKLQYLQRIDDEIARREATLDVRQ